MFDFLRNIFSDAPFPQKDVYSPDDIPEERQEELVTKIAKEIVERQMSVPAIIALQTLKPVSFLGSQFLIFAKPIVDIILPIASYQEVAVLFESPENVERLLKKIEEFEDKRKSDKNNETKEETE